VWAKSRCTTGAPTVVTRAISPSSRAAALQDLSQPF